MPIRPTKSDDATCRVRCAHPPIYEHMPDTVHPQRTDTGADTSTHSDDESMWDARSRAAIADVRFEFRIPDVVEITASSISDFGGRRHLRIGDVAWFEYIPFRFVESMRTDSRRASPAHLRHRINPHGRWWQRRISIIRSVDGLTRLLDQADNTSCTSQWARSERSSQQRRHR